VANQTQLQNKFRRPFSRDRLKRKAIEKIIDDRHGTVPDTDDADLYVGAVATCFVRIARESGRLPKPAAIAWWCEKWAPRFTETEQAAILDKAINNFWNLRTDDDWGRLLRLSDADRTRLQIRSIGSYDVDRAARLKRCRTKRHERDRLRAAENRRTKGAVPRNMSLARTKPWEQLGISRATFMRRRKAQGIETNSSPHPSSLSVNDELVSRSSSSSDSARAVAEIKPAGDASNNQRISEPSLKVSLLMKGPTAEPIPVTTRAESPVSDKPPPSVAKAVEIARQHSGGMPAKRAKRLFDRFWPGYIKAKVAFRIRYYGQFKPDKDLRDWPSAFRAMLDREAAVAERYQNRRRKWKRDRADRPPPQAIDRGRRRAIYVAESAY
jgi:hypothetical protein